MSGAVRSWVVIGAAAVVALSLPGCELFYPRDYSCPSGDCPGPGRWDGGFPDGGIRPGSGLDPGADLGAADAGTALRVINWNILWFGSEDPRFGLEDDQAQLFSVRDVMRALGPDVWGLQEIADEDHLANLIAELPGYDGFSQRSGPVTNPVDDFQPRTAFVYRTDVVEVLAASNVPGMENYDFAYRPPLRVDARVRKGGATVDVTFLILHFKAGAGSDDWTRRRDAAVQLKAFLDANLPTQHVLVIGDFNDDLDESISSDGSGGFLPTPFSPFLDDPEAYTFVTEELTDAGLGTTVRYSSSIDHQLASNEMAERLEPGSVRRIQPNRWPTPVDDYTGTTSDHYPIEARYQLLAP